jgi:hypothetical protein
MHAKAMPMARPTSLKTGAPAGASAPTLLGLVVCEEEAVGNADCGVRLRDTIYSLPLGEASTVALLELPPVASTVGVELRDITVEA